MRTYLTQTEWKALDAIALRLNEFTKEMEENDCEMSDGTVSDRLMAAVNCLQDIYNELYED